MIYVEKNSLLSKSTQPVIYPAEPTQHNPMQSSPWTQPEPNSGLYHPFSSETQSVWSETHSSIRHCLSDHCEWDMDAHQTSSYYEIMNSD